MTIPEAAPKKQGVRWLEPKTLGGTMLVFAVGYAVWQPLAQVVIHALWGEPLPFATRAEWVRFALVAAAIGTVAGAAWYHVQRMGHGWRREWADNSVRMLAMGMIVQARSFAPESALWWFALLFTSVFMGALLATITHAMRRSAPQRERPVESPAPPP